MEEKRKVFVGNAVSAGIAVAKAYVYEPLQIEVEEHHFEAGKQKERLVAFHDAVSCAEEEINQLYERLVGEDAEKAKIFAAHREILEDEEMIEEIQTAIQEDCVEPDFAIYKVFTDFAELLSNVADPLIAARTADLQDVKNRLIRIYQGKEEKNLSALSEEVIVIAHDLLPSDTATLDRKRVKGIVTEIGGYNSHSAILARSFQLPAILGVTDATRKILDGELLAMDALTGELILCPGAEEQEAFVRRRQAFLQKRKEEEQYLTKRGAMKDGTCIQIGINIGSAGFDAPQGSFDFVGLFRTEFLYMESDSLPTEEVQFTAYRKALEQAHGKPVTLRTLDIGGDKTLPYMELPKEQNPFLGKRALRLCLSAEDIFLTQLRAALRASAFGLLQIMFPMVGSMEDIFRAKEYVKRAMAQLDAEQVSYDKEIKLGIMIEIPSIALIADIAAEEVDFASIGSNDLTQYVSAADRMNQEVTSYYQNYSPAMVRLLGTIFEAFDQQGKPVSVCGEMAGNPRAAVLLAGLGAKKLSMSTANMAGVKAALAQVRLEEAKVMAAQCKNMRTQGEITEFLRM